MSLAVLRVLIILAMEISWTGGIFFTFAQMSAVKFD